MMEFFKIASRVLLAPVAITFFYDLIAEFVGRNRFLIHKFGEWWVKMSPDSMTGGKAVLAKVTSSAMADKFFNLPAPVALAVPALVFYVIYRVIFLLQGGKSGGKGGLVYKSRH